MADSKAAEEGPTDIPVETTAQMTHEEGDEAEYFVDEEANEQPAQVVVVMCILNQGGSVLQGKRIWRRLAVPSDFSLLELHVALQNAFDWEDTHLHDFSQPLGVDLLGGSPVPSYTGSGRTDIAAYCQQVLDLDDLAPSALRSFKSVVGVKEDPVDELLVLTRAERAPEGQTPPDKQEEKTAEGPPSSAAFAQPTADSMPEAAATSDSKTDAPVQPTGNAEGGEAGDATRGAASSGGKDEVRRIPVMGPPPGGHCLVYVEHSHPHSPVQEDGMAGKEEEKAPGGEGPAKGAPRREPGFRNGPTQVLEERAFLVGDVLAGAHPVLVYEYDFRMGYEVHLFFEGRFPGTEGVNYPTCLAGAGASPAEDGDDMDDQGNLLPSYDYDDFAVLDVLANLEKTFEEAWPLGPGAKEKRGTARCYLCRYNRECGRRRDCNGRCCTYCIKAPLTAEAGRLPLSVAHALFETAASRVWDARRQFLQGGRCAWTEDDGQPCMLCSD